MAGTFPVNACIKKQTNVLCVLRELLRYVWIGSAWHCGLVTQTSRRIPFLQACSDVAPTWKKYVNAVDFEKLISIVHWHVRPFISSKGLAGYRNSTVWTCIFSFFKTLIFILYLCLWAQSLWWVYILSGHTTQPRYFGVHSSDIPEVAALYLFRDEKKNNLSFLRLFTGLLCRAYNGSSFLLLREIHFCWTKLF